MTFFKRCNGLAGCRIEQIQGLSRISSSGVGAINVELKLPCNMNVKGILNRMKDRIKFHHTTEFLTSLSRQSGLNKFSIPPEMILRSSFLSTHGDSRSHINGEEGPLEPTKVGRVLCTQKCGTKLVRQFGHCVLYSWMFPGVQPATTSWVP